jgi:superfamily II DNA helicase RecQ
MTYGFYRVPAHHSEWAEADLNAFLRSHRVLSVDRRWVDQGEHSFWEFCVDYLETSGGTTASGGKDGPSRERIDYKQQLSPADFQVFVKLRDLRKEIAQAEAIPMYMVFTNEQLARMCETRVSTKTALEKIIGVGSARIEKYGSRFLELLQEQGKAKVNDAKGQSAL